MSNTLKFLGIAAICLTGAAIAQPAPPDGHGFGEHGPNKAEMAKFAAQMCQDRKAHVVGELAFVETKLALSDKQKPLFEHWKKVKLAEANGEECAPPPEGKPSIVDHLKREEKFLQVQLANVKAELPVLEALYASLSEEQKKAFAPPPPPGGPNGHGPHDGPMGGPGMGPGPMQHGRGPDGAGDQPPPAGLEH